MEREQGYVVVEHAVKKYKETTALDDVSLSFEKNKIHGIIGRNGSGKTVLLKCMAGLVRLTQGEIHIDGKLVGTEKTVDAGVIIETPGFLPNFSGYKNLKYLADLRGKIKKEEIYEVMRRVNLDPENKKWVGKYSLGMRQRLGIAQAIMENPPLLLLDEPTNGLDRHGVEEFRSLLRTFQEEGKTIIMASHSSEDIHLLCDTVHELDGGKLVEQK